MTASFWQVCQLLKGCMPAANVSKYEQVSRVAQCAYNIRLMMRSTGCHTDNSWPSLAGAKCKLCCLLLRCAHTSVSAAGHGMILQYSTWLTWRGSWQSMMAAAALRSGCTRAPGTTTSHSGRLACHCRSSCVTCQRAQVFLNEHPQSLLRYCSCAVLSLTSCLCSSHHDRCVKWDLLVTSKSTPACMMCLHRTHDYR